MVLHPIDYDYSRQSIAVDDFNNDKWLDIVVVNRAVHNMIIFRGAGSGNFATPTMHFTGLYSTPYMVAVDDFNNDHRLDIAVANFDTNCIGMFMGIGNGSFNHHLIISTSFSRPIFIHIIDLNNDTLLDIITANYMALTA